MAMLIETKTTCTYDDYAALPEGAPYELIHGNLVMTPSPTPRHQIIESELVFRLQVHSREHQAGRVIVSPIDVFFSDSNTYQPDIIFIARDRLNIIGEKRIEGAPDLVVEVLSPSNAYYDLMPKRDVYESSGVKEYWIVDPMTETIEVFANTKSGFTLLAKARNAGSVASKVLDGFSVDLQDVFGSTV